MREIKFRGLSVHDGTWVYGSYVLNYTPVLGKHGKVLEYRGEHYIWNNEPGQRSKGGYWHKVNPETVCEFTGSYDMTGNPIYEGDIVEKQEHPHLLGRKRTVVRSVTGGFMTEEPSGHDFDAVAACIMYKRWVVIGNKFENPGWVCED